MKTCAGTISKGIACPLYASLGSRFCAGCEPSGGRAPLTVLLAPEEANQRWRTPRTLARAIVDEGGLTHDAAADHTNHVVSSFWSRQRSALDRRWPAALRIWDNPPFGIADRFAERHITHMGDGGTSYLLVLDRGAQWLEEVLQQVRWWRFTGRVEYEWPPEVPRATAKSGVTFGSVLARFDRDQEPGFMGWRSPVDGRWVKDRRGRHL